MKAEQDNVAEFFDEYPTAIPVLARRLRAIVRAALLDAREELDRSDRVVGYSYGPGYAGLNCTIILSKRAVKLGIVGGAHIPDPAGLLEGSGTRHRYVAFNQTSDLERAGIDHLIQTAKRCWKGRQREKA